MGSDEELPPAEPEEDGLLGFLKRSGIELKPEQRAQFLALERSMKETHNLVDRFGPAHPINRNKAALKLRWENKDRNVGRTELENGTWKYELRFTPEQKAELEAGYLSARPPVAAAEAHPLTREDQAEVFVRIIESWAASMDTHQATTPESQKDRKRALASVANALMKLDQTMSGLDSEALGWWYAGLVDKLAVAGVKLSEADDRVVSMRYNQLRAVVEAGERQRDARRIIGMIVEATNEAAESLPKFDHGASDIRLVTALQVERLTIDHQISFEETETGFPAKVLKAMFDLAGIEIERVSYWLKKASEDPRSHALFIQSLRDRLQQK